MSSLHALRTFFHDYKPTIIYESNDGWYIIINDVNITHTGDYYTVGRAGEQVRVDEATLYKTVGDYLNYSSHRKKRSLESENPDD